MDDYTDGETGASLTPPANTDYSNLSNESLEQKLTQHTANVNAATCQQLLMIAEFDRRQAWGHAGTRSCAHWLNWRCGISTGAAREKVRVGHALAELPETKAAFESGKLSYSKARAITRVATPANEDCLLSFARYGSASQLELTCRLYRQQYLDAHDVTSNYHETALEASDDASDENSAAESERQTACHHHDHRKLSTQWDEHGCLIIRARLTPEQGALVLKAIESAVESIGEDQKADDAEVPHNKRDHDENVSAGTSRIDVNATQRHFDNRRADALVLMAESLLQNAATNSNTADRYQVVVHVDQQVLAQHVRAGLAGKPDCYIENQVALPVDTARRLCCSSKIIAAVSDGKELMSIGRSTRAVPSAMMRALRIRDGVCQFPGCACVHNLDAHHIVHWANEGETSMENLMLVCHHHHKLLHEGGFNVQRVEGELYFTCPDGSELDRTPEPSVSDRSIEQNNNDSWQWCGDTMDYSSALCALISRSNQIKPEP